MRLVTTRPVFWVSNQVQHNRAVQPQIVRGLKFCIEDVEGLYYLCSENKGADQLCDYHAANLRLCFRIGEKVFLIAQLIFGDNQGLSYLIFHKNVSFWYS